MFIIPVYLWHPCQALMLSCLLLSGRKEVCRVQSSSLGCCSSHLCSSCKWRPVTAGLLHLASSKVVDATAMPLRHGRLCESRGASAHTHSVGTFAANHDMMNPATTLPTHSRQKVTACNSLRVMHMSLCFITESALSNAN